MVFVCQVGEMWLPARFAVAQLWRGPIFSTSMLDGSTSGCLYRRSTRLALSRRVAMTMMTPSSASLQPWVVRYVDKKGQSGWPKSSYWNILMQGTPWHNSYNMVPNKSCSLSWRLGCWRMTLDSQKNLVPSIQSQKSSGSKPLTSQKCTVFQDEQHEWLATR